MSYSKQLYDKITLNPWTAIYDCLREKCDFAEIGLILKDLLMKPINSKDYMIGLELLKSIKSQAPIKELLLSVSMISDDIVIDKIMRDTDPDLIIREYTKNYFKGMGLITLLELYPLFRRSDEMVDRIKRLLLIAPEKIDDEKDLRELLRAVIYGPLSVLTPNRLKDVLMFIRDKLTNKPMCLQVKADIISMVIENYPPRVFEDSPEIIDLLIDILRDVAGNTVSLLTEDLDRAVSIYSDINIFMTEISRLCKELGRFDLCRRVWNRTGNVLDEMYERIGKIIISFNNINNQ